jgi:hypothetical protein
MRSHWWPSAATSAFLVSGLEMLTFVSYLLVRRRTAAPLSILPPVPGLAYAGFILVVTGVAAEATAMWGINRQQRAAALTFRLSQIGIVVHIASALLMLLISLRVFDPWLENTAGVWVFQVPRIPEIVTFGILGWATTGENGSLQRWASTGLITMAVIGCLSIVQILLGWATQEVWQWITPTHVALRAATWVLIGMWLRAVAANSNVRLPNDGNRTGE